MSDDLNLRKRQIEVMLDEYEAAIVAAEQWYREWKQRSLSRETTNYQQSVQS